MPLTDGQHSELLAEYKNLIDFYFNRVKAIVATAEREDTERRMVITSVIEIRSAFDHLMRVEAFFKGIKSEEEIVKESQLSIHKYCEKNLSKAYGHLYRAAYDAYDLFKFLDSLLDFFLILKKVDFGISNICSYISCIFHRPGREMSISALIAFSSFSV